MQKGSLFILISLLLLLSGCDLYLPGCGGATTLGLLSDQALKPFDIETLAEIGMVTDVSSDMKSRQRVCQATIQPKRDFSKRYSEAKQKIGEGEEGNVLGMIGRALVSAALPDRLEDATIQFQIARDERSQGFGVVIDGDSMDLLTSLAKGYKLADIAISRINLSDEAHRKNPTDPSGGNI